MIDRRWYQLIFVSDRFDTWINKNIIINCIYLIIYMFLLTFFHTFLLVKVEGWSECIVFIGSLRVTRGIRIVTERRSWCFLMRFLGNFGVIWFCCYFLFFYYVNIACMRNSFCKCVPLQTKQTPLHVVTCPLMAAKLVQHGASVLCVDAVIILECVFMNVSIHNINCVLWIKSEWKNSSGNICYALAVWQSIGTEEYNENCKQSTTESSPCWTEVAQG